MPEQEYVAPEDMDDDELYEAYQDAKEHGPVNRLDELQLEIAQRWEDERIDVNVSRGHVRWDESVPDEFLDLFIETVEQSEYMTTEWQPGDPMHPHDVLVIKEVQ